MTTINNPTAAELKDGDVLTLGHRDLEGSLSGLKVVGNQIEVPAYGRVAPGILTGAGYTIVSLERPVVTVNDPKSSKVTVIEITRDPRTGNMTATRDGVVLISGDPRYLPGNKFVIEVKKSDFKKDA